VDTEVVGTIKATLTTYQFNPAGGMARLTAMSKLYRRFRIVSFKFTYASGSGTATTGNLAMGILAGPPITEVKLASDILKLTPSVYVPAWKNATIAVGRNIDSQKWLYTNTADADGVAFTLYAIGSAADLGIIRATYNVQFSYPKPFQ
jgi:hypothetical protein